MATDVNVLKKGKNMPRSKTVVVVTRKLPDAIETRMMELFDVRLNLDDHPMNASELAKAVKVADVLVLSLIHI